MSYNWSINVSQGIVAFLEGLLVGMKAPKSAVLAVVVIVSSAIPPAAGVGMEYNEKMWEIIIATIVGGLALNGIYDGGFIKEAIQAFIIDASSMAATDAIYNSFILGGANPSVAGQRAAYPGASFLNRINLG